AGCERRLEPAWAIAAEDRDLRPPRITRAGARLRRQILESDRRVAGGPLGTRCDLSIQVRLLRSPLLRKVNWTGSRPAPKAVRACAWGSRPPPSSAPKSSGAIRPSSGCCQSWLSDRYLSARTPHRACSGAPFPVTEVRCFMYRNEIIIKDTHRGLLYVDGV